jgi:hypothetical protein
MHLLRLILLVPIFLLALTTYALPLTPTNSAALTHPPLQKRCLAHILHKFLIYRFDENLPQCEELSEEEKDKPTRGKYAEEDWLEKKLEQEVKMGGERGIPAKKELEEVRAAWKVQLEKWEKQAAKEKVEEEKKAELAERKRKGDECARTQPKWKNCNY